MFSWDIYKCFDFVPPMQLLFKKVHLYYSDSDVDCGLDFILRVPCLYEVAPKIKERFRFRSLLINHFQTSDTGVLNEHSK